MVSEKKLRLGLLGRKVLRCCIVKGCKVVCDGLCRVSFSDADDVHMCPVEVEAFDLVVNCQKNYV